MPAKTVFCFSMPTNFEFKARCADIKKVEAVLQEHQPSFIGEDHQTDTYFNVPHGRMKLREGNIENALIHYIRSNSASAKQSEVLLYQHKPDATLKQILSTALGVKVVVEKSRKIYFIQNIKFHFDEVKGLGTFLEVEAIDKEGNISIDELKSQCKMYAQLFKIESHDFIAGSYSDMLLEKNPH